MTQLAEALDPELEKMMEPPELDAPRDHPLFRPVVAALREVYDPEIPVNLYELGLIYKIEFTDQNDVKIEMSLTSPGCPVAGEMPGMVRDAIYKYVEGVSEVNVELVWEPTWDPSRMADTARLELNM